GVLKLDEAVRPRYGVPYHHVTVKVAKEFVLPGDPVRPVDVRVEDPAQGRELRPLPEEREDVLPLPERGAALEQPLELLGLLATLGVVERDRLEVFHPCA